MTHRSFTCSLWCVSSSLSEGGLVFVDPMRDRRCKTMLDPFHAKYGKAITAAMSVISLFLDVIWVPTILVGLGTVHLLTIIPSISTRISLVSLTHSDNMGGMKM